MKILMVLTSHDQNPASSTTAAQALLKVLAEQAHA